MATKHHTTTNWPALAAWLVALAIASAPIVATVTMEAGL